MPLYAQNVKFRSCPFNSLHQEITPLATSSPIICQKKTFKVGDPFSHKNYKTTKRTLRQSPHSQTSPAPRSQSRGCQLTNGEVGSLRDVATGPRGPSWVTAGTRPHPCAIRVLAGRQMIPHHGSECFSAWLAFRLWSVGEAVLE